MLQELKLWELSLATFPMNEQATIVAVKSLDQVEALLRGIKASDVDPGLLVRLRGIEVEVKRLRATPGDPAVDEQKVKERVEELEALEALAAKISCYVVPKGFAD